MPEINLYCNCFKDKLNKRVEYNQKNLMLGSTFYELDLKENLFNQGFLFDDKGDNISHLNKWFGQLTGLYWVWKNTEEQIIGTNTYRLFWGDYFKINQFKKNTLYLPNQLNVIDTNTGITNLYEQYAYCHGYFGWGALEQLSNKNKIPIKLEMIEEMRHSHLLYSFNMFITERNTFNKICSILFDIIFNVYDSYNAKFEEYENTTGQQRILDFLSERILHIIYSNKDYYFSNIDIETTPIINLDHNF